MFAFDAPFGSTIFCDDVRTEIGGKSSFMGVYNGSMLIPTFPATLPKFGIAVFFNEPMEMARVRDFNVNVRVFMPSRDEPLVSGDIAPVPEEVLTALSKSELPDDPDVPKLIMAQVAFLISPFPIQQPGRIRVRALYGSDIIKLGSMRVEHPPK